MASENLLRYIWDTQIMPQAGYSFSRLHAVGYSLIALQEMNLAHYYPQVYWNTACLSINGGADENNDDNKSTNYGKIAAAIGNMKARGISVALPDINKAKFGFTPDLENNSIVFGLKGINGVGDEICHSIIENRPYHSFEDFLIRMFDTKLIKKSHMLQLIKGGCFDSFGDRMDIMRKFISHVYEPKQKLTMANLKMLIEMNLVPQEYDINVRYFRYKEYISKLVYKIIKKPKDKLLKLDEISSQFFNEHFTEECVVDIEDGALIISEKQFKKEYDKKMENIKEWMSKDSTLKTLNDSLLEEEWNNNASGSISSWEMSSLSYYYNEHELVNVNRNKYNIVNFTELPEDPSVAREYEYRGRPMKEYNIYRIVGTVLDKDKNKHNITILTPDGVVTIKQYAGQFSFYNKQISQRNNQGKKEVLESSWYTRGNKIMVTGFRRGNQFVCKTYKNSIYQHTVALIEGIDDQGNLTLKTEREQG
jgi:DNA polymerase III subunit alpha